MLRNESTCGLDHIDRPLKALVRVLGPRHQAMVGEHDPLVMSQVADDLAQLEARTNPVHVGEPVSQGLACDARPFSMVSQRADGIRVHVIDVGERQEGVQEGLNRGAPRAGIHQSPGHKIGHLFVGHLAAITQRCQFRKT